MVIEKGVFNEMKEEYEQPVVEIIELDTDVIITSCTTDLCNTETPPYGSLKTDNYRI